MFVGQIQKDRCFNKVNFNKALYFLTSVVLNTFLSILSNFKYFKF